jgi:hypothetical protein
LSRSCRGAGGFSYWLFASCWVYTRFRP